MDAKIEFLFREKLYEGQIFVEGSELPCLVFVILYDKGLVEEFGDEITLRTDFDNLLPRRSDYQSLNELREAIFSIARNTAPFLAVKEKWKKAGLVTPNEN
jgi:hypothetical protein